MGNKDMLGVVEEGMLTPRMISSKRVSASLVREYLPLISSDPLTECVDLNSGSVG